MKSLEELVAIRDKMQQQMNLNTLEDDQIRVVVGLATCGIASGARPVLSAFTEIVAEKNIENVLVTQTGCIGLCQYEPIVEITQTGKEKVTYVNMTPEKVEEIVQDHLLGGKVVRKYTISSVMND